MDKLPDSARTIDLLKWVEAHPNQAFDPNMVISATHASDWQWQAVIAQMEDLRRQSYIMKLKQDPWGSTYWNITSSGTNYLNALARFKDNQSKPSFNRIEQEDHAREMKTRGFDEWDVFISHASEDKGAIARPLAEALRAQGLRVWYDEFSLTVGDSLRKKIDQGLANSRFGIVILSAKFFEKHWPEQELNGLATREVDGKKVILPIWHGVSFKDVQRFSPMLADRIAVNTDKGLDYVIQELLKAMKPGGFPVEVSSHGSVTHLDKSKFKISLQIEGTPPLQWIKLIASYPVVVERVEYMLSNDVGLAGEDLSIKGQSLEIPLNDNLLLKVWNTPRSDRNSYDHSGPAKLGVTVTVDGSAKQYVLPVHMEMFIQNSTVYRKVVGSKTFFNT